MNVVMISCRQRAATERAQTLRELAPFVHPIVTESSCDPAGPSLNRHAAWHAITSAPRGPLLFIEDDITPGPLFLGALVLAVELGVLLDLNLKRRRLLTTEARMGVGPLNVHRLEQSEVEARRGWYGTQCVYLPEQVTELVRASQCDFVAADGSPQPAEHGFDFWLKEHAEELGGMHALDPPAVRHRNPPSMRMLTRPAT